MTRHLTIAIEAGERTCDKCRSAVSYTFNAGGKCVLFEQHLLYEVSSGAVRLLRCPACLEAEKS